MRTDVTFTVSREALWKGWLDGRVIWDTELLAPTCTDLDAFTPHGSENAIDRWADDGGRVQ